MKTDSKRSSYSLFNYSIILIILLYLAVCHYFQNATVDDVYISLKYAKNLAHGNGLVFNIGERVEGYSNFLWVVLLAAVAKFFSNLPLISKLLSVFFGAGAIGLVWYISRYCLALKTSYIAIISALITFVFSISYAFVFWSPSGMETTLYTFLILLSILVQLNNEKKYNFITTGIVFILLGLCRVEGIVFFVFSVMVKAFMLRWPGNRIHIKNYFYETIIVFSVFAVFLIFRYLYFGGFMPNTYYAKIGGSPWFAGWAYFIAFLQKYYFLFILALIGLFVMRSRQPFLANLLIAYLVGYISLIIYIGGDWMWHFRFFVPLIPLLYIASANTLLKGIDLINKLEIKTVYKISITLLLFFFLIYALKDSVIREGDWKDIISMKIKKASFNIEALIIRTHKNLALYLNTLLPKKKVVAANHIGALGYYSEFKILDMVGLIDPDIAKQNKRFHEKYDVEAVLSKKPDYVILTSRTKPTETVFVSDYWIGETALYNHPEFRANYFRWKKTWQYTFNNKTEYLAVFERKDKN